MSHALQISSGFYDPSALAWVIASAVLAAAVLSGTLRGLSTPFLDRGPLVVVLLGLAWAFAEHATSIPGYALPTPIGRTFHALLGAAAAAVALIAVDPRRARAAWFPAALAAYAALGVWIIAESPNPHIDVYAVYYKALHVLRSGHSPYSMTFTNIYGGGTDFYAEGAVQGSTVNFGFPYPPLALLMALPGAALGDLRYAGVGAMVAAAAAFGYAGRGRLAMLAAALLLFTPRGLFVVEQAWSEPFVICWLALLVYAAVRRGSTSLPLGALLAVKQHLVLALPFAPWLCRARDRRGRTREIALALAITAVVTVPFFVADPRGFWRSAVALQFAEPFRWDSLSVLVPIAKSGWVLSPGMLLLIPAAAVLAGGLLAWLRAPRTAAGFAAALGFVFVVLFLVSKKAFCNYYFLVLACWCGAVAASDADTPPSKA